MWEAWDREIEKAIEASIIDAREYIDQEGHTSVSAVQFFGRFETWPKNVVYVGMPGNASRAFGIPDDMAIFGKPWETLKDPVRSWPEAYKDLLVLRLRNPQYADVIKALHGRMLLCWCAAKNAEHCHAMILAEFIEMLHHEGD